MLSTPPAFILSQDQTLMLKSFVLPELIWQLIRNNVLIYCFKVASFIEAFLNDTTFSASENVASQWFVSQIITFLKIFQGFSLFSYQGSLFCRYQRQLLKYNRWLIACQQLFKFIFCFIANRIDLCRASRVSLVIISCPPFIVNNKFHFFCLLSYNTRYCI